MRSWFAVMACLVVWSVPAGAQWIGIPTPGIPRTADGKPNLTAPAPRSADGKIDLSGIWLTPSGRWLQNLAADGVEVPFRPATKALYDERRANNGKGRPSERCISHGVTDFDALGTPTKILQTPGVTVVLFEAYNHYRQIFTDGRPLPANPQPAWLGYSVGKWEGDTFVVETIGLNDIPGSTMAGSRTARRCASPSGSRAATSATWTSASPSTTRRRTRGRGPSRSPRTSWSTTS